MTINEKIIDTLQASMAMPVIPDGQSTDALEYIVFSYSSTGDEYGDDAPHSERYSVLLHYLCPLGMNSLAKREQIKRLLFAAEFSWPDVTDGTDETGQDWIFECEYLAWIDPYG
jgi:hypothetical protein